MATPFTFVSVIVMLLTCVSYSSSGDCNNYCSWETWGAWNMECPCGVKDVRRNRTRGCESGRYDNYIDWSKYYKKQCWYDSQTCVPLCYNGGKFYYKEGRCACSERFAGKCCKESKSN